MLLWMGRVMYEMLDTIASNQINSVLMLTEKSVNKTQILSKKFMTTFRTSYQTENVFNRRKGGQRIGDNLFQWSE